jgi:CRP-like cAMP-binding protein
MATAMLPDRVPPQDLGDSRPLIAKIQRFVTLSSSDVAALDYLCSDQQTLPAHHVLTADARRPSSVHLILSGLAVRYNSLPRRRQILAYLAPGDFSAPYCGGDRPLDCSVMLLTESLVATVSIPLLSSLSQQHPQIERGILLAAMADLAILREWLLNIGQRSAYEKLGHFFCELTIRLEAAGLINDDGSVDLPFNQSFLADTTGLTHIHVNRILKRLRAEGLIARKKRLLTVPDPARLLAAVGFERIYLDAPFLRC